MDFKTVLNFFQNNVSDPNQLIDVALKTLGEGEFILDMVKTRLASGDSSVLSWFNFNDKKSIDELFFAIDFFGIRLSEEVKDKYRSYIRSQSYNEELFIKNAEEYDKLYWNKYATLNKDSSSSGLS